MATDNTTLGSSLDELVRLDLNLKMERLLRLNRTLQGLQQNADHFYFVTLACFIVALMVGFICIEVGLVRTKNATNVLLRSMLDLVLGCSSYWLFGFAIVWSEGNSFIGWKYWALAYTPADKLALAFNQLTFANSVSTIVCGSIAERLSLKGFYVYCVILTGFAYPFVCRWCWYGGGWLKSMGFRDFGGSGIVHLFSGTCAVVAAIIIGPRAGRFSGQTGDRPIPGHSLPLVGMGTLILILGLMGFNAASQMSLSQPGDGPIIVLSALNTLVSCSSGALTALFLNRLSSHYWSYVTMINGSLAAGVAICAGCGFMAPWAAFVTGIIAGGVFLPARSLMERLEIDDVIDSFAIHVCGGLIGLVTAPFLVNPDGIFFARDPQAAVVLGVNMLGALVIIAWAIVWSVGLFGVLSWAQILRIPLDLEVTGVDLVLHNEPAYSPTYLAINDGRHTKQNQSSASIITHARH